MQRYKADSLANTIRSGDIVCVRNESIIGKIIRWVTESNINHVALYIGNGLIIESTLGYGVRIAPLSIYTNNNGCEISICRSVQKYNIQDVVRYSYNFYGAKYDLISQIGIFARFMVQKIGLQKMITFFGRNKINHDGFWCSEFLGLIFLSVNIKFNDIDISYLSPADIYNSLAVEHIDF